MISIMSQNNINEGMGHLLMKPSKASIIPDRLAGRSPTGLLRDFSRALHSVRNDKKVLTVISICV